ncbi:TadE family protein [Microbacterium sp. MYb54]|nr:TadE family protein [Microbacterium sp. MYb43]PQZ74325.1 TadE family protein [Microbacterium sp. MYb40]PRB18171.1 TadE family protein [Microbacterium sp. MYb54]PRB23514.1 TadE family protein [Microbacterium sp. MYb50]PRB62089.1 TadE family protein [Microbacterium sp. MYb24]PRB71137.1 TadE family protein [Microbacterium sp. MYb32]
MRRPRRSVNEDGSAALEFIAVGVILLVPLVYLVIALGAIQEQTLGAEAAARHIARVISRAPDAVTAAERSDAVLAGIVDEYGLDADAVEMTLVCTRAVVECPSAGATIIVTVATRVQLPLVPEMLGLDRATAVPVQAEAVQKVSRLWGSE